MDPVMGEMLPQDGGGSARDEDEDESSCSVCGKQASNRCSKCKKTWYCSRECQASGWKNHKKNCRTVDESEERNKLGPFDYYHSDAHTVPEARELANWLGLTLPTPQSPREGIL